ncbi:hypothetical protein [Rhizobium sp. BT03]|uniref:hypothetical protein n=1 Tax=Rhizobium sp. BT03 TaxID=3045156 RepID=UPI0024B3D7C6|nr:hypothetical protein [Rhizobium sp. BT03]WHO75630.1 hypothetical protein QMO80_004731 [Rhizobium sp. BT03]
MTRGFQVPDFGRTTSLAPGNAHTVDDLIVWANPVMAIGASAHPRAGVVRRLRRTI